MSLYQYLRSSKFLPFPISFSMSLYSVGPISYTLLGLPCFYCRAQDAKTSFFQRQFCSGLKLFRNFLSWQGILSDAKLREIAISSLLNRYLLSAMRVCTPSDAVAKAHIIVYTLPRVWLQPDSDLLPNMEMFTAFLKHTASQLEPSNPVHM